MELKIRSLSYEHNAMRIGLLVREFAAACGRHNLDAWLDGCRSVAATHKLSVVYEITLEQSTSDPKKLGNRITAVFRDQGDPSDPVAPVCRLWRGRRKNLEWVTGQLVFDGDDIFILTRDAHAGWCWFAVDQLEPL
ncbi:MAG: hypothetical protein V8T90_15560 [Victivallales bacterium]